MSLNGLDDVKVKEAHDAAIAEPGGWFLLKYVSRDEIDLLGRGNGGIVELRNAIANFEEDTPLFGFLRYRRRSVIIKYVPENCSRLVQARVTVHFNAVSERFSPHDTIFTINSSKELRDTSLSNACSLHTASGSTSSSTSSLRRRRLMEIAEDEEEDKRASTVVEERPPTAPADSVSEWQALHDNSTPLQSPGEESMISFQSTVTDTDNVTPLSMPPPPRPSESRPKSPTRSIDERRTSSQTTRPEPYSYNSYTSSGKPKIKLGPRPSLERPHTSASSNFRPVSTLPAGLKLFSRSPKKSKERPQSQHPTAPPSMTLSPPPLPGSDIQTTTLVRPHTSGGRPNSSSGGSIRAPLSPGLAAKQPTITPEKARLMKALQMRKKQMSSPAPEEASPSLPVEDTLKPEVADVNRMSGAPKEVSDALAMLSDMAKADSGIAIEASSVETIGGSQTTRTSSTPASPVDPSEADSTQASSVSESTDETVQEDQSKTEEHSAVLEREPQEKPSPVQQAHDKLTGGNVHSPEDIETSQESQTSVSEVETEVPEFEEQPTSVPVEETVHYDPVDKTGIEDADQTQDQIHDGSLEHEADPEPSQIIEQQQIVEQTLPRSTFNGDLSTSARHTEPVESISTSEDPVVEQKPQTIPSITDQKPTMDDLLQAADAKVPIKEWKIPRSKFSVQNLKATTTTPSSKSPISSTFSDESKRSLTDDEREHRSRDPSRKKRKGLVEPIRTDIDKSSNNSETEFLSDDELMDELHFAQVQEAKPVMVSKSPITPVFPNLVKKTPTEGNRFSRAFSQAFSKDNPKSQDTADEKVNVPSRSVSASAAYLNRVSQQPNAPMVKKVNLGSGISQRIKALEKLSSTPNATPTPAAPPVSSPSFFSVRKTSNQKSPSIVERAESLTRHTPSPSISRESSPEALKARGRSGSIQTRSQLFTSPPTPMQRSRPESISVTARIMRDPNQPLQLKAEMLPKDPLDYTPLDLKQSHLVIDHQKAIVVAQAPKETIQTRRLSKEQTRELPKKERRSSMTVIKDFISDGRTSLSERRTSFTEGRKSMTIEPPTFSPSVKSPSRPPSTHTNSPSHHGRPMSVSSRRSNSSRDLSSSLSATGGPPVSSNPTTPNSEEETKKSGRASRMLRRMSSSLSASRKSLAHAISPTVREESEPPQTGTQSLASSQFTNSSPSSTVFVEIGDVNVQFPDTLLWKRRSMSLDSQGYLLLSQAQGSKGMEKSTGNKRYHLSEFRTPFVPEMEAQELPNSVVLDFVEGSGLQIACEDRGGQMRVLQVLQEAHRSWAAYGQ